VRSLLYILLDRDYAAQESILKAQALADQVGGIVQGLIRSFQESTEK